MNNQMPNFYNPNNFYQYGNFNKPYRDFNDQYNETLESFRKQIKLL